jgi:hypothetical protein
MLRETTDTRISWRTYQQLSKRQAAGYNEARYTPAGERTHKQEKVLFDLRAVDAKRTARVGNVNRSVGRVHTSSGSHVIGR